MLKPVDLQVLATRSLEVQRAQEISQNRVNLEQRNFAREMTEQSAQKQNQVQRNEAAAEGNQIHDDKQENAQQQEAGSRQKKQDKENTEEISETPIDKNKGLHIDIKA